MRASLADAFVPALAAVALAGAPPAISAPLVSGRVLIADGAEQPPPADTGPALYVTVRPSAPDNVPRAILDGSRGKPPPIAASRFAPPLSFPFEFTLDDVADLTPEGAAEPQRWWASVDRFVVSARLDSDGVAATRAPTDLVGQSVCAADGAVARAAGACTLRVGGRGSGGRLITSPSK